ncbi:HAD family hydrolase [Nesterenkonia halotolerans]|uniref:HAD family hydrolase n=1 Tax=Nesterenkonia halotolerans TaxID=225325 RepID=UPI003EE4B88B
MTTALTAPDGLTASDDASPPEESTATTSTPRNAGPAPRALLLDFGGVVVSTTPRADWASVLGRMVQERALAAGFPLELAAIEQSLRTGRHALGLWKNAASRRMAPRELAPREIVEDFLLVDLPAPVRSALALDAGRILAAKSHAVSDHHLRPGVTELLDVAREHGIRVGIVSNAHSGRAHRDILTELGIDSQIGVQVYSDEVGIRKPHAGMVRLAAEALGAGVEDCWYVGDTLDRDVVAGRRAGVAQVLITRDRRTDHPPFDVAETPDRILDSPVELLAHLREALAAGSPAVQTQTQSTTTTPGSLRRVPSSGAAVTAGRRPLALLLDHGGVITTSVPNPQRDEIVGDALVDLAARSGVELSREDASAAIAAGWERHRARKRERDAMTDPAHRHEEVDPGVLWGDLIGRDLPDPLRAALRIEARELSHLLHRTKGVMRPRPGALELIRWCEEHGVIVGIVSNTISGRGVREQLDDYAVGHLIGPAAYSDEIGVRKPGRAVFDAALAGLEVDPADVVYVGDKVRNDGTGGTEAAIGTIGLLRGGKDKDEALDSALADGLAHHVLDETGDVIDLLTARLAEPAVS